MTDNFSDHPLSVSELKASKDHQAQTWTPRDVLISLLREIDSGEVSPDVLVVAYAFLHADGGVCPAFKQAHLTKLGSYGALTNRGLLDHVKNMLGND